MLDRCGMRAHNENENKTKSKVCANYFDLLSSAILSKDRNFDEANQNIGVYFIVRTHLMR